MTKGSEEDLVLQMLKGVAAGDEAALKDLYEVTNRRIFAYVYRTVRGDGMLAEEILVDTYTEVWKGAGKFEGRAKAITWMFGIARNIAMNALRHKLSRQAESLDDHPHIADDCPGIEETLDRKRLVRAVLGRLSQKHREVLEFVFFQGLSYREIGEILGVPENTVKTRVFYAKDAVREELARMGVGNDVV